MVSLARARERSGGLSQAELARRTHVSRGLVGMMESGDRTPTPEFIASAAKATGDYTLIVEASSGSPLGLFSGGVLDKADLHPVVVQSKFLEEMEEAIRAVSGVKLINKRDAADFTAVERTGLERAADEVYDLFTCCTAWLINAGKFGICLTETKKRHHLKLKTRGYSSSVARS